MRIDNRINLRYKVIKSQEELAKRGLDAEHISVTKNISAGGILFIANELLPLGTILELKIELPGGEKPVECLARVVRMEEVELEKVYYIGACFLDLTGADRARLDRYVEKEK